MTFEEFGVFLAFGEDRLCAIVCVPTEVQRELGVVLLTGGNYTRSHRNGMWVRTSRALAERGFASIRLDYHGVGDSTGTVRFDLGVPFDDDVLAAIDFLQRATNLSRFTAVATCFGGISAMAASARHPDVIAATIFPVPLLVPGSPGPVPFRLKVKAWLKRWDWARRLLGRPAVRRLRAQAAAHREAPELVVSPRFKRDLMSFLERGDVRFVYGEHTDVLPDLRQCLAEMDPVLTPERRDRLHLDIVPGVDLNRFQTLEDQDIVVSRSVASVEETFRGLVEASAHR